MVACRFWNYVNVKFNVFTKVSNECDPIVDGNDAPSGMLRVVPFEDPLQLVPLLLGIVGLIAWIEWLKMYVQLPKQKVTDLFKSEYILTRKVLGFEQTYIMKF